MATLALDTSTSVGSVAVARGGEVLGESVLAVRATHSESVLPEIQRLVAACDLRPSDLDAVVVGSGPGSFTGVRIAASLAKGLCFARGADLYAYSSLAAVAAGAGCEGRVCALFDARRGQVYAAGYRVAGDIEELFSPRAASLEALLGRLGDVTEWSFAGDGTSTGEELIVRWGGRILPAGVWHPRASSLVWLSEVNPAWGRIDDPHGWEPRYVRLPAAQRDLAD